MAKLGLLVLVGLVCFDAVALERKGRLAQMNPGFEQRGRPSDRDRTRANENEKKSVNQCEIEYVACTNGCGNSRICLDDCRTEFNSCMRSR